MPQLDASAFWGLAGILVGVVVSAFFFIIGKKKTLLQYSKSSTLLVSENMTRILNNRMSIDGQPVKSLSSTTISFVNSGNQRIQSSDFSKQEPLRVILKGHMYGYDVSRGNQQLLPQVRQFPTNPKAKPVKYIVLEILFENLKPRQFFSVTILHDGTLDVLGGLTTGTMREHSRSWIFLILMLISMIVFIFIATDYMVNGPVFALIGSFEVLLSVILILLTLFFSVMHAYKTGEYFIMQ